MIDLKPYVYQTLTNALGAIPVHYFYPPENADLPCVTYREAENRLEAQADAKEHLTEIAFVVDIWGKTASGNSAIGATVNQAMTTAGFRRSFSHDLYEPGIHHKTMRYRVISDQNQYLTQ